MFSVWFWSVRGPRGMGFAGPALSTACPSRLIPVSPWYLSLWTGEEGVFQGLFSCVFLFVFPLSSLFPVGIGHASKNGIKKMKMRVCSSVGRVVAWGCGLEGRCLSPCSVRGVGMRCGVRSRVPSHRSVGGHAGCRPVLHEHSPGSRRGPHRGHASGEEARGGILGTRLGLCDAGRSGEE